MKCLFVKRRKRSLLFRDRFHFLEDDDDDDVIMVFFSAVVLNANLAATMTFAVLSLNLFKNIPN